MKGNGSSNTINAVETTLTIVEVLKQINAAGVSEIADEVGIPVSTTYMHLNTLRHRGYVTKSDGDYRLSLRFLEHGGAVRQQMEFFGIIQDVVNQTAYLTGEIVGFGVEEQGQRVALYRSEGGGAVGDQIPIGEYTYLHWTSLGKVILAHLPDRRVDEIIDEHGLPQGTPFTITDRSELEAELASIRADGYATDDAERRRGIRGAAVPIMDADETIVGSLGVAGPEHQFTEAYLSELIDTLLEKRNVIEIRSEFYE
ncbi:IclR family transcriptional regulator [Halobacterium sp. KA-6]|uniref:IclR family transcriptional regulator n=1 Tax=Halobacterium sp. KA-6 TaxID=2896368 RepID=UPI001E4AB836|nr:IclR family transcriptional regulator [Halobacterium sp. KA-6]MCD2204055.1 IclR family transcriptional regulator [Halobacterium sp. KA-6]